MKFVNLIFNFLFRVAFVETYFKFWEKGITVLPTTPPPTGKYKLRYIIVIKPQVILTWNEFFFKSETYFTSCKKGIMPFRYKMMMCSLIKHYLCIIYWLSVALLSWLRFMPFSHCIAYYMELHCYYITITLLQCHFKYFNGLVNGVIIIGIIISLSHISKTVLEMNLERKALIEQSKT